LLALDPADFLAAMTSWRTAFLVEKDAPVMGLTDEELKRIDIPTTIVPYYDKMHPFASAVHAQKIIPDCSLIDFAPSRHANAAAMAATDPEGDSEVVAMILCDVARK
jgi:hypothetical protein